MVIDGGTIDMATSYTDSGRGFTIGAGGATLAVESGVTWQLNTDRGWQYYGSQSLSVTVTNNSSLTLDGAGTGEVHIPLTGTGTVVKNGGGTWSLSGANSYTGATTVNTGTLVVSNPNLSDTATLAIASGAVLNLPYVGTDTVGALVIHGVSQPDGVYDSTNSSGAITGTGKILVGSAGSADYLAWAKDIVGFTDTYPTHDPDGDGMTNQQEYAFGLDPTKGSSSDPIVVPLNKTAGTFSYTRQNPLTASTGATGLTYVIYTSTNLSTWTADTGATQNVTGQYYDVQTVEVTLSGLPLTAPKLFVRVAAE
jgi:autotransporter-associated beta strand protein